MIFKPLVAGVLAAVPSLFAVPASAGQTVDDIGSFACVVDKWDEKETEKGHKLVDYAGRCVLVPDDPADPKASSECTEKCEYLPDESWKGSGNCTYLFKSGDQINETWEEGSHLKEYLYKFVGGTGRYKDAKGGGTYTSENLTDTLSGGKYRGKIELP
jgi:hypothetical protein